MRIFSKKKDFVVSFFGSVHMYEHHIYIYTTYSYTMGVCVCGDVVDI